MKTLLILACLCLAAASATARSKPDIAFPWPCTSDEFETGRVWICHCYILTRYEYVELCSCWVPWTVEQNCKEDGIAFGAQGCTSVVDCGDVIGQ